MKSIAPKPSQDIFSNLLYGAQTADRNVKGLSDFAELCDSAAELMESSPGLSASERTHHSKCDCQPAAAYAETRLV